MVPCHGAASRRSPAQLCGLPDGAVPRRCHKALTSAALRASLWCSFRSGFFFAAASSSVPRSPALQQSLQRSGSLSGAAASSSAQTSASLHPPAALRLRVLSFTGAWSPTVCAEELPDCAGSIICHPAAAHWQGGSHIQHLIPAPQPCNSLIWRRYGSGVGNRCRCADRYAMSEQQPYVAARGMGTYMLIGGAKGRTQQLRVSKSGPGAPDC